MSDAHAALCRRLGHRFADDALLARALRHRSKAADNNERLEFLGDSILNFVISQELYRRFPELPEGDLTRLRASLVRQDTLARLARDLALGPLLELGAGENKSGGFDRDSILSDAVEAVLAAVLIDAGVEAARTVILRLYAPLLTAVGPHTLEKDPKTRLQELLQKHALPTPTYNVLRVSGEPHQQTFTVECIVDGLAPTAVGEGGSRRHAEQAAAAAAYERLTHGQRKLS